MSQGMAVPYDLTWLNGVCMPQSSILISMDLLDMSVLSYLCMYVHVLYIRISDSICMYGFDVRILYIALYW